MHFAKQLAANMGGTEICKAMQTANEVLGDVRSGEILLVTDGEVSSWRSVVGDAKRSGHRIFTVGVGNAVSEAFVRELACSTGGECELVAPREDMAERIIRHFERMRAPRAKRVVVHWPEGAFDFAPTKLVSVFDGDTVVSTARFNESTISGPVVLEVATETGETLRQELTISEAPSSTTQSAISTIARFAASVRLKELAEEAGLKTALYYRLVSPRTNWLVIAARLEGSKAQDIPAIRKVLQTRAAIAVDCDMNLRAIRTVMPSRKPFRGPVSSAPLASKPLFRLSMELGRASTGAKTTNLVEFLKAVPPDTWHEISIWTSSERLLDLSQRALAFWKLVRFEPKKELTQIRAIQGVEILKEAQSLGFKLSKKILREARRLGIELVQ